MKHYNIIHRSSYHYKSNLTYVTLPTTSMSAEFSRGFLSIILIGSLVGELSTKATPFVSKREVQLCTTPICQEINEKWLAKVDVKQDPCEDFYQFACGKYQDTSSESAKSIQMVAKQVLDILKTPIKEDDHRTLKNTKQMFRNCLNHSSNLDDMKKLIGNIGGWPLLNPSWDESDFSLGNFYSKSIEQGYIPRSLFTIDVYHVPANNTQRIIHVTERNKHDDSNEYEDLLQTDDYDFDGAYVSKIVEQFNVDKKTARKDFKQYEQIRKNLITAYWQGRYRKGILKLKDLRTDYPFIPWMDILEHKFRPTTITDEEPVLFECLQCIESVNELIRTTSKRNLVSYLMWSLVLTYGRDVHDEIFQAYQNISPERKEKYCAARTASQFKRVVDYEYVQRYFDKYVRDYFYLLTVYPTSESMPQSINESTFDPIAKKEITEKMFRRLVFKIAYDDEIASQQQVEEYYADLTINPELYFPSLLNLTKFTMKKTYAPLREPSKAPYLSTTKHQASYTASRNYIYFGASFMTGVFALSIKPGYIKYATTTYVVAHERHHAIDHKNMLFDPVGNKNNSWLTNDTKKELQSRQDCFVNQYSQFVNRETGDKVNGSETLDETFSDNGAVHVAYKAYDQALRNGELAEPMLPDFKQFEPRQMFWIILAGISCRHISRSSALWAEQNDPHPLGRVRVNGAVMNSVEFAKDFHCKPNSPMNPDKKCEIWK